MKYLVRTLCLVLAAWFAPVSFAQETSRVLALQPPAWVERDGNLRALRPDRPITAGDTLVTGDGGRLLIDLPDGADLKIGSEARFAVNTLRETQDPIGSLIEGVYEISKGAFRYTTRASGANIRRSLSVKVGMATVGIRGTDFWGLTTEESDTVVLLEGAIVIEKEGHPDVELDQALTFYNAPRSGAPQPVQNVDMEQLPIWAASVEMVADAATISSSGSWGVYLGSFRARQAAGNLMNHLDEQGYPAEIKQVNLNGSLYRVAVAGFLTRADALKFVAAAESDLDISGAWIQQM